MDQTGKVVGDSRASSEVENSVLVEPVQVDVSDEPPERLLHSISCHDREDNIRQENEIDTEETQEDHLEQNEAEVNQETAQYMEKDEEASDMETCDTKTIVMGLKKATKAKKVVDKSDTFSKYDNLCTVLFSSHKKTELYKIQKRFDATGSNCQNVPKCIADMAGLSSSLDHGLESVSPYSTDTTQEQITESDSEVLKAKQEYFKNIEMHKSSALSETNEEGQVNGLLVSDNTVTVKFQMKSQNILTCAFKMDTTILEVKDKVASILNTKSEHLIFLLYDNEVDDWIPLAGLGVGTFGTLELEITVTDPNMELLTDNTEIYIPIVDVITVKVLQDGGCYKYVTVEIENQCFSKEWLGGYRNRKTMVDYYHAYTQTKYWLPEYLPDRNCRDTQTPYPPKTIGIDTPVNKATQMWRGDHYVPCVEDKIMMASPYKLGIQYPDNIIKQVIVIQSYVRGWITRNMIKKWKAYLAGCLRAEEIEKEKAIAELNEYQRNILVKQVFPSSRNDFYMLYAMVEKWVEKERKRIKAMKTDEAKKSEYAALLQKEIQMLSTIEKHKAACKREILRKKEMLFLVETSKPKVFTDRLGKRVSMDTIGTQRAREFKEIYNTFIRTDLSTQERIDMLMTLRHLLQNYEAFEWTKEIIVLIERECDLLTVGLKDTDLVELRKRIEQLFMDLIHKPEINPEAAKYNPDASKLIYKLNRCVHCSKVLPRTDFLVHARMKSLTICTSCDWVKNFSHMRIDLSPYKRLLKLVRDSEMQRCCFSSDCFILQEMGMYYLVHVIWQGHSVISEKDEISQLRLIRWHDQQEWSVGNIVLMTVEEAKVHRKIKDIYTFYSQVVIDKVKTKQQYSKLNFKMLLNINNKLKKDNIWGKIHTKATIISNAKWDSIMKDDNKLPM